MHDHKPNTRAIAYAIIVLGALFYCYEYFLRISPSVMKPELMSYFHIDATMFGTLSAFYFYAYTPMQLVVGILVDRYRPRYVLTFAVLMCAIGSMMMVETQTYALAAMGRFLQGFGSAFAFVGALKLASNWMPHNRFAFFAGAVASLGFLGAAVGEVSVAVLVQKYGWRETIGVFTASGFVLAVFFWFVLHKRKGPYSPHRLGKVMTLRCSLEHLLAILKVRRIWAAALISCFVFLPTSVFASLWGVPYMEKLHHYSPTKAAIVIAMIFVGWAIGSPLLGYISDRLERRVFVMRAGFIIALLAVIPILYMQSLPTVWVCVLFILFGICSAAQGLTFVIAKEMSPSRSSIGTAIAFVNMLSMMGGLIFQRGLGEILDWSWTGKIVHGIRFYDVLSYERAVTIIPISIGLAIIVSFCMRELRRT